MAVNGRVITGYSLPKYYLPTSSAGTSTDVAAIARGVDVNITAEGGDAVTFYADNGVAEVMSGGFTTGTLTLTVDGLKDAARTAIFNLPTPNNDNDNTDTWQEYKTTTQKPYVCVGFVVRFVSEGATSYVPFVLPKTLFKDPALAAATQAESIEFQTETLEATIFPNNTIWKYVGATTYSTESDAETALIAKMATVVYPA